MRDRVARGRLVSPHHFHEHDPHKAFFREHFVEKGREVALACLSTLDALKRVPRQAA